MWTYRAKLMRVVDGDTVDLEVDMGFRMFAQHRFRILGIDTPELRRGTEEQKEAGRAAKKRVEELMKIDDAEARLGNPWDLTVRTEKADSFGRYLAEITLGSGADLGDTLLAEGHAIPYKK